MMLFWFKIVRWFNQLYGKFNPSRAVRQKTLDAHLFGFIPSSHISEGSLEKWSGVLALPSSEPMNGLKLDHHTLLVCNLMVHISTYLHLEGWTLHTYWTGILNSPVLLMHAEQAAVQYSSCVNATDLTESQLRWGKGLSRPTQLTF